jgi:hypothetical protein
MTPTRKFILDVKWWLLGVLLFAMAWIDPTDDEEELDHE